MQQWQAQLFFKARPLHTSEEYDQSDKTHGWCCIRRDVFGIRCFQALAFSKEIFGDGSIEMVPPYLLLSEANLGLGALQSAEGFLSMANWSILKTPKCSNAIRSQVTMKQLLISRRRGREVRELCYTIP